MAYQDGELEEKYIKDGMSRVEEIAGYSQFFEGYMDILADFETAEKLEWVYNGKEFFIERWGLDTFFLTLISIIYWSGLDCCIARDVK